MFCKFCGSEILDDAQFCTSCGAAVGASDTAQTTQPATMPAYEHAGEPTRKTPPAIAWVVAAIAVIAALVFAFASGTGTQTTPDATSGSASTPSSSSSASPSSSSSEGTVDAASASCDLFRITLPDEVNSRVTYNIRGNTGNLMEISSGSTLIAIVAAEGELGEHEADERKFDRYSLGTASDGSVAKNVTLSVYYLSSQSDYAAHWGDSAATELTCQKLLGLTPEQLAHCIELRQGNAWAPANFATTSASGNGSGNATPGPSPYIATPSSDTPFWGIWIGASKDQAEAQALADEATAAGLGGSVVLTTDWSNLNAEPWYVITAGRYLQESEAQASLGKVQQAGYGDAYVKYTGDYQGA